MYHSVLNINFSIFFLSINPAATAVLVIALLVLFVLSFFVAGSEVAFFSLTQKDINMLKTKQQPSYRRIVTLLEQPKTLLAAMLIANCLVNIGIILISNVLIDGVLGELHLNFWINFSIKVLAVTSLLVLFGEILPKIYSR